MTERDAAFAQDDGTTDGGVTRPYRPGSRLRRALDLAREAHAPSEPERTTTVESEDVEPHAASTAVEHTPYSLPAEPTPEPAPDATRPVSGRAQASRARKRGLGRGLDALLSQNGPTKPLPPATWESSAQGWVQTDDGLQWRTVVTTVERLERWNVATYLGIVTGRSEMATRLPSSEQIERAERGAVDQMVEAATTRGAHGIIGVTISLADGLDASTVIAAGTAVTLANRP